MLTQAQLTGRSSSHLIDYQQHQLQAEVAAAYARMCEAAADQGVVIAIASAFRSFDRQLGIWNRKFNGEAPIYSDRGELLQTEQLSTGERIDAILTWSALPGASRHHWGTDLDLYDPRPFNNTDNKLQLIAGEYAEGGPCYDVACWLQRHAHEYGFFLPYARYQGGVAAEPWHVSYRVLAEAARNNLSTATLASALTAADIQGKRCILARLADIKERYVDNICTDNGWSDVWCG